MPRQMTMVAFLQAQNCSNYPGSWRHPETMPDFLTAEYYQRIGRILEDGCFDMAFFDDRLAIPDIYGGDYRPTVAHGIRAVKLDPIPVATAMALATRHLGIAATYSTTYYEPFHVARVFATLDALTGGRAAWNVVTSVNDSEAANFGAERHLPHDLRYDRADEFLEVVLGHWDAWEADALILDREADSFADPAKVHRLDHAGRFFRSRGPFTVPRSAQGRPVLIQAGQSGRGRSFAARWADVVFMLSDGIDTARRQYRGFKDAVSAAGRDPAETHLLACCYVIAGETSALAEAKRALIDSLAKPVDTLALLSEVLNFDFAAKAMDETFSDEELAAVSGMQAYRDRVVTLSGKRNPTVADFVAFTGRGTIREHPTFCGPPRQIADAMEEWFIGGACDGFILAATHMPGAYEEFVRLVVPELQRRGLTRHAYRGTSLRENLGLSYPERGAWRRHQTRS